MEGSISSTRFKHMPCATGASITSNVLRKLFLCIGLAMQLHLYPMCFGIVHIIGLLAYSLHTMWTTHHTPQWAIYRWRLGLDLGWYVKLQTSIAILFWKAFAALMEVGDIKSHMGFCSILWPVQITPLRFISGWALILQHKLLLVIYSLWWLLL